MLLWAFKRAVHTQMPVKLIELKQCYKEEWANIPPPHLNNLKFCKDQMFFFHGVLVHKKIRVDRGCTFFLLWLYRDMEFEVWLRFFFSLIFFSSRCMMIMTWGRSSWTRPHCCPPRSSLKTFLKNSLLMWYMSFYCQQAVFLPFFSEAQAYKDIHNFLYLKNHIIYTMFLMLFLFFLIFSRTMEQELWSSALCWTF